MPIANCFVRDDVADPAQVAELAVRWSEESGIDGEHMTVNLARVTQAGAPYRVMAFLHLPSLWNAEQIDRLQLGLARALADYFGLPASEVHVITSIVQPGHVVEEGETQRW